MSNFLGRAALGSVMIVVALSTAPAAHADAALSVAFKNCTSDAVSATASAVWNWKSNTPTRQDAAEGGACARDVWSSHVEATGSVASKELSFRKIPVVGSSESRLGFHCSFDPARNLFEKMSRYSTQNEGYWADGAYVITRRVGESLNCNRRIRDAEGNEVNYYWCNFILEVNSDFVKALNL